MFLSNWRSTSKLPIHETDMIIEHVCGLDKLHIILDAANYKITENQYKELCYIHDARFEQNYPLQYLLGYAYFMDMRFKVTPDVLIPRPDTEFLIQEGIFCIDSLLKNNIDEDIQILDLCTGSGCIAIYLANKYKNIKNIKFTASDISSKALEISKINNNTYKTNINFILSDLFESPLLQNMKFDIILSNPPYISYDEKEYMSKDTLKYEPELALYAQDGGMEIYKKISKVFDDYLKPNGHLLLEIGFKQSNKVTSLFNKDKQVKVIKDFNGHDRVVHVFN